MAEAVFTGEILHLRPFVAHERGEWIARPFRYLRIADVLHPQFKPVTLVWRERFLERLGYENLELYAAETGGGAASFRFAPTQDGVPRPDDALTLSVALDDGTVCAFDATRFRSDAPEVSWNTDEEAARATLPEGIEAQTARRVIRRSPGGSSVPCWELSCADGEGRQARVYVDARSGRPWLIEL